MVPVAVSNAKQTTTELSTMNTTLTQGVRQHAEANYEKGGWDVVVECWSDSEISQAIGGARTLAGAIKKMAAVVGVYAERQADAAYYAEEAGQYDDADVTPAYGSGEFCIKVSAPTYDGRDGLCGSYVCSLHYFQSAGEADVWLESQAEVAAMSELSYERHGAAFTAMLKAQYEAELAARMEARGGEEIPF